MSPQVYPWFAEFKRVAVSAAVLRGGGLVDLVITDSGVQDFDPKNAANPPIAIVLNVGTRSAHKWMSLADVRNKVVLAGTKYEYLLALPQNPFWQLAKANCNYDVRVCARPRPPASRSAPRLRSKWLLSSSPATASPW